MYENGLGVSKDYGEAIKWYCKAAERGDAKAQHSLATMYLNGKGVDKNSAEALKWFLKAAEQGNVESQVWAGWMYGTGNGTPQDYTEALKWYSAAADQGDAMAQSNLGTMYLNGRGVESDYAVAAKWYLKAAEKGLSTAQYNIGKLYYDGTGIARNYAEAFKWLLKAAEQGMAEAQRAVGAMYDSGTGTNQDCHEAFTWILKAVAGGNAVAFFDLGGMYETGRGTTKDLKKAVELYLKSAELGYTLAQCAVAYMYKTGKLPVSKEECVSINLMESVKWCRKAAEQGDASAQILLADSYLSGQGVNQDFSESVKWYRKAAEHGLARAQYSLGRAYENGEGVTKNVNESMKWYRKAAEQGHHEASKRIKQKADECVEVDLSDILNTVFGKELQTRIFGGGRTLKTGDLRTLVLPGGAKMEMIYCSPGEFVMGSPASEDGRLNREVQHHVRLTKGFWLGKYPVTQKQWQSVMGCNPSRFTGNGCLPVDCVSWDMCKEFVGKVSASTWQQLGGEARFPTEAEWEYACRAGTTTAYCWGDSLNGDKANCDGSHPCGTVIKGTYLKETTPVGYYDANAWGFYDMHGNVSEWCADWYSDYSGDIVDPIGPASGVERVLRGGSWNLYASSSRSAWRFNLKPNIRCESFGFRLYCSAV